MSPRLTAALGTWLAALVMSAQAQELDSAKVATLARHAPEPMAAEVESIERAIQDLAADDFDQRERAESVLSILGMSAVKPILATIEQAASPEQVFRLESLLERLIADMKVSTSFYTNGQLKVESLELSGSIRSEWQWHRQGQTKSHRIYVDRIPHGVWLQWHKNGQLSERIIFFQGKVEGLSETWYETGKIKSTGQYRAGKLEGLTLHTPEGEIELEAEMKNGVLHGRVRRLTPDGYKIEQYEDGRLVE